MKQIRTPEDEERRYEHIQGELKDILDAAAENLDLVANLLRAQLYAVRYRQNEDAHTAFYARAHFLGALEWRAAQMLREAMR